MLDFGFSEILLTSAIALVVLGPEKLPKVARQVGNWMGRARLMARQLSEQLEREVNAEELLRQQPKSTALPPLEAPPPLAPDAVPPAPVAPRVPHPTSAEAMHAAAPPAAPPPHPTSAAAMHPAAPTPTTPTPQQSPQ
jgi:sec-independent protein translocase protein TatB